MLVFEVKPEFNERRIEKKETFLMLPLSNHIPSDVVVKIRGPDGQRRYIVMSEAAKAGERLVGLHFGRVCSVSIADIVSAVAIMTGTNLDVG